jgi:hypothetical protein
MSSPVPSEAKEESKEKSGRKCNLGATEILWCQSSAFCASSESATFYLFRYSSKQKWISAYLRLQCNLMMHCLLLAATV